MLRLHPLLLLPPLAAALPVSAQTPAFPGALGFGAAATGGRGGSVYHVTNLNDSGAGSFRDAVSTAGRTVVFDVGGYITLSSECGVKSNITIAGQTAPGGGIGIRGAEVTFGNQSNIICRFVRFRPGGDSNDTDNGLSLYQARNVIVDHCSIGFAKWNNIDAVSEDWQNRPVEDISVTNCIIANPIGQQFGAHTECVEGTWFWHGNIFSSGHNRQPLAKINTVFINNTVYNYSAAYTTHTSTSFKHDIVNNYFIGGPASAGTDNTWFQVDRNQSIYYSGNYKDRDRDTLLDGTVTTPYWYQGTGTVLATPWSAITPTVPVLSAAQAVVRNNCEAGALPHDELDAMVISQVLTLGSGTTGTGAGTAGPGGGLYTSQTQTGLADSGYGVIAGGNGPVDSDRDGMPDDWEAAKGLNPASATDGRTIVASGYSNLEEYLNWLALPHAFVAKNTAAQPTSATIDLLPWLKGFPAGTPVVLSAITGGTASINNGTVTFTPAANSSGMGSFTFSASGGGYTLTKTAGILISPNAPPRILHWKGDGTTNAWNTTAPNWTSAGGSSATVFSSGDRVTLDDTGSTTPAIALSGTLAPGYMEKSSGIKPYTIGGSGSLSGPMALSVSGAPLTLQNSVANSYTGGTFIEDALLTLGGGATPGSGPVTFLGNATLTSAWPAAATLPLGGNQLKVDAGDTGTVNCSARTAIGGATGGGIINLNVRGAASGTGGNYLTGPWSGFTGTVNIRGLVPGAQCDLNINGGSFDNFGQAFLNLDAVKVQSRHNTGGNTIAIGSLNGTATATLGGSSYAGGCTYEIGARGDASVFYGAVTDGVAPTTVTKVGGSTLELTGTHAYTGPTNVTAGTFYSGGAFAGLLNINGGSLSPRSASAVIGQITANGGLTLQDCTLSMDLSPLPSTNSDRVTCPAGTTLSLKGTELTFRIKFAGGYLTPGTYPLVDGGSTLVRDAGIVLSVTSPLPAGARQTLQVVRNSSTTPVPAYLNLVVTGALAELIWTGAAGSAWDVNTTANWTGAADGTFYPYDSVTFDDTAAARTVTLTGSLLPRTVKLQHDSGYTINGAGTIDGTARLEKSGTGTAIISSSGASTFNGGTLLSGGEIFLDTASASPLGSAAVTLSGGTLNMGVARSLPNSVIVNDTGTIKSISGNVSPVSNPANSLSGAGILAMAVPSGLCTLQGRMDGFSGTIQMGTSNGTLRLNGSTNANYGSAAAHFDLGSGSARLANRNGGITVELGAVSGGPNTVLQGRESSSGPTTSNYLIGGRNEDCTFSGRIVTGGDASLNITKTGTGTWTLGGSSNYTGDFTVQKGRTAVKGSLTLSGDLTVRSGATLTVDAGSVSASTLEIEAGATVELCGSITGTIVNHGTLRILCPGQAVLNGSVENSGRIFAAGGSRVVFAGSLENTGLIDLIGSPATSLPAGMINSGTVLDASVVKIQSVSRNGTAVSVSMQTHADHSYILQTATEPGGPWSIAGGSITVQTSPAGVRTWTIFGVPGGKSFYRIGVGP